MCPAMKRHLCGHKFGEGRDVATESARSLVKQDTDLHEQGIKRLYRDIISVWLVAGTMHKNYWVTVKLSLNSCY